MLNKLNAEYTGTAWSNEPNRLTCFKARRLYASAICVGYNKINGVYSSDNVLVGSMWASMISCCFISTARVPYQFPPFLMPGATLLNTIKEKNKTLASGAPSKTTFEGHFISICSPYTSVGYERCGANARCQEKGKIRIPVRNKWNRYPLSC